MLAATIDCCVVMNWCIRFWKVSAVSQLDLVKRPHSAIFKGGYPGLFVKRTAFVVSCRFLLAF